MSDSSVFGRKRLDLYAECNVGGAPVDEWKELFCNHCINPECSRSLFGQSKFDLRVNTWKERLFTDVPTMEQDDPRFEGISAQKFMEMAAGGPLEVSSWAEVPTESVQAVKPVSGLKPPEPLPEPEPPAPVKEEVAPPEPDPEPEPVRAAEPEPSWKDPEIKPPEPPAPAPQPPPATRSRQPSRQSVLANTPAQPRILQGAKPPSDPWEPPRADPWATPVSGNSAGEVVVKPGAKVKVGKP